MDNRLKCLIVVLPLSLLVMAIALRQCYGPYFYSHNFDPEYAYLLNALNILHGEPPAHHDHPGTPLQILGALVILARWLLTSVAAAGTRMSLNEMVFRFPEETLASINTLLVLLVVVSFVYASIAVYSAGRNFLHVLVFQAALMVPLQVKVALMRVSPEPLLIVASLALTALLAPFVLSQDSSARYPRLPLAVGFILGFGIATKVTFFPLLLLVFLFEETRQRRVAVESCMLSFVSWILPVSGQLPEIFRWFLSLALHKGTYGEGDVGIPGMSSLFGNVAGLFVQEPFYFAFMIAFVVFAGALLWRREALGGTRVRRCVLIGASIMVLLLVMTAKHPSSERSGVHYMLPAIAIAAFLNVVFLEGLLRLGVAKRAVAVYYLMLGAAVVYGTGASVLWASALRGYVAEEGRLLGALGSSTSCEVIKYYRCSFVDYALAFGNDFSGKVYGATLSRLYPKSIVYNRWNGRFYRFGRELSLRLLQDELKQGGCYVMIGSELEGIRIAGIDVEPLSIEGRSVGYAVTSFH